MIVGDTQLAPRWARFWFLSLLLPVLISCSAAALSLSLSAVGLTVFHVYQTSSKFVFTLESAELKGKVLRKNMLPV